MDCVCHVALVVNCGYARVCIYQNSNPHYTGKSSHKDIDIAKRQISSLVAITRGGFGGLHPFQINDIHDY